ncbi:ribonuclease Z [Candidatus Leptofilum sp.]|uniref:ribonuclease Z n=1 Tax=Candidatus Leptofilum sp. TaxID=3241576 RepID=UPI003B596E8D
MFELIFLGTSASAPSIYRGLSAHIVLYREYRFLIDCGEGTQRQILHSGLGFKRLNKILLTHGHLDHILGLGGFVSTLARWENMERVDIFAGRSTLRRVADLLFKVVFPHGRSPLHIELTKIEPGIIMADDKFTLSAFSVQHRGPDCFGFLFEEKAHRPFLAEKAAVLGVPFGPERAQLVRGEAVTLADGRIIQPDDVLGEALPGTKYVHVGDVGRVDELLPICQNAHTLVIEATYLEEDAELAHKFGHMTAVQAARLAKEANVGTLILTHLSRRYNGRMIRKEAQAIFPNTHVARDFDHFQITRDGAEKVAKNKS